MIKLLIVTPDKETFHNFTSALIKNDVAELTWAATGQEALEAISGNPVDLVILMKTLAI